MTIAAFLTAAVGPLVKRGLAAIGFGVVSYVGLDLAVGGLLDQARTSWGGLPADAANYMALAGINQALSIIAGAYVARIALVQLKRLALL